MSEADVTKMKVADLKRELKIRGLSTTGNKNELQDRLQSSLLGGELSLDDTAISGEDLLDDPELTDEEEKILGADENELLQSPNSTPTTAFDLAAAASKETSSIKDDALNTFEENTATSASRKIVLKRKNSLTINNDVNTTEGNGTTKESNENGDAKSAKTIKLSEHKLITMNDDTSTDKNKSGTIKVSQLTMQERLEMRAKKFGITTNKTTATSGKATISYNAPDDDKQIDLLKKRAERFGCVVSSKIAKIATEEKLNNRKKRFGIGENESATNKSAAPTSDVWAEKARLRLERFKVASGTETKVETTAPAAN